MGKVLISGSPTSKSTLVAVTLSASGWSNSQYTIEHKDIAETNVIEMFPGIGLSDSASDALVKSDIVLVSQTIGQMVIKASAKVPTVDVTVLLVIRKDT